MSPGNERVREQPLEVSLEDRKEIAVIRIELIGKWVTDECENSPEKDAILFLINRLSQIIGMAEDDWQMDGLEDAIAEVGENLIREYDLKEEVFDGVEGMVL